MSIRGSATNFLSEIWEEIRTPLKNIIAGTLYFIMATLLFKIGTIMLNWIFTEESWFLRYIDIMAISALILSYLTYIIMSLARYCYDRIGEMKREKEVKEHE